LFFIGFDFSHFAHAETIVSLWRIVMLNFIKGDPSKKLRRELDAARARRSKLGARLDAAENHLSEARGEPIKLARDGAADAALDGAEAKAKAAEARVSTLRAAISNEDDHIAELELQLAELADRAQRQETADQLDGWSVEVDEAAKKIDVMIGDLADLADRVAPSVPEAAGVAIFAGSARSELALALQAISNELNGRARGVRAGAYAATLPNRPPPPAPLPLAPIMENVWVVRAISWKTADGRIEVCDSNRFVALPQAKAQKAILDGVALPLSDARAGKEVRTWRQQYFPGMPELARCHSLDGEAEAAAAEQKSRPEQFRVLHSTLDQVFEPVDRGAPFTIKTAPGNANPEAAA
jgi:hypothetical protein